VEEEVTMVQVEPEGHEEAVEEPYLSEFPFLNHKEHCFHQRSRNITPDTWILLDSQSTVSVLKNWHLLSNIRASDSPLCIHTGGVQFSSQVGTVKTIGEVWFNPDSLANIMPMAKVSEVCRITMDTLAWARHARAPSRRDAYDVPRIQVRPLLLWCCHQ
jgi:hypothetical protein